MKTKFCLILFIASVFCAPSELLKEDEIKKTSDISKIESTASSVIINQEVKILPVYETKLVHSSHLLKTCSPNCHLEIFEKPLYLVVKSDPLSEPKIVFLKDGLKSFQPSDKIKLPLAIGQSVIVLTKNDLPIKSFPQIINTKATDLETMNVDVPYVMITDNNDLMEINRDEKYEKVAEMEVTSDGLIKGVKLMKPVIKIDDKGTGDAVIKEEQLFKPVIKIGDKVIGEGLIIGEEIIKPVIKTDDKVETEPKARTIGSAYKMIPVDKNLPVSNFYETFKVIKNNDKNHIRVDNMVKIPLQDVMQENDQSKLGYPKIRPVETQAVMDDIDKIYNWQLMNPKRTQLKTDPVKPVKIYVDNSYIPDKLPYVESASKFWYSPSIYQPTNMNYYPEQIKNKWTYEPDREMYNIDPLYDPQLLYNIPRREPHRMDYFTKEIPINNNADYYSNYILASDVNVPSSYKEYPKIWENKYDPNLSKYLSRPVLEYNNVPSLNSHIEMPHPYNMRSAVMTSDYNIRANKNISLPKLPLVGSEMSQMANPIYYYDPTVMNPMKMPNNYPMYNYPVNLIPPKYSLPYSNPGMTYILNLCQDHKPVQHPLPVEHVSLDHEKPVSVQSHLVENKKPESVLVNSNEKLMYAESPSNVIYKDFQPDISFRTDMTPDFSDTEGVRKIFIIKKPHRESNPPPSPKPPVFSPPELPPVDIKKPSSKSLPFRFVPIHN